MSLIYSGGPYRNDLYTSVSTRQALLNNVNTTLLAAGWSSSNVFAFSEIVWSGQPTAAQTVTVNGQVYTWRATVSVTANEVLIGASASASLLNLQSAINLTAGSGTTYGSATAINTGITASDYRTTSSTAGRMRLQDKINTTPFGQQNARTMSIASSNITLTFGSNQIAGYMWTSARTPFGQQIRVYGIDALESFVYAYTRFNVMDEGELYRAMDFTAASQATNGSFGARLSSQYSSWRIVAGPYQFGIYADSAGAPTGGASSFYCGVPYIPSFLQPQVISDASNTNPIQITTGAAHTYTTGDNIINRGIGGNTAANGVFVVTVIDSTHYTIPVAGNGVLTQSGYTSLVTGGNVAMTFFTCADESGGVAFPYSSLTMSGCYAYQNVNGVGFYNGGIDQVGSMSVMVSAPARTQDGGDPMLFANGQAVIDEPHIAVGSTTTGKAVWVGQLYDTFTSLKQNTLGQTATVDGHTWWCMGGAAGSTTRAEGSLFFALT